ncbi:MAG TPA: molybdopterin-binding protein [Syntrophomonas sp.]|nr:molybdopterin-binding protein [Syntrophomonas sp.]
MQIIKVEESEGTVLCHDITRIVIGEGKGPAFCKGHIITAEDIPELRKLGKRHVYVWKLDDGMVHENDAAIKIARAISGTGLTMSEPREGKVNLIADGDGMCKINEELLYEINMIEEVTVATRSNRRPIRAGEMAAGVRVIPLVFAEEKLTRIESLTKDKELIQVAPYAALQAGIVITGNEIYSGLIEDQFGPVLKNKMASYGCNIIGQTIVPDEVPKISQAVLDHINAGAQIVLVTGGMSVDPDDVTPTALRAAGAEVVSYGAPVLPGSMIMVAYIGEVPVLGLPGCVMYNRITIFDLILPSILTGEKITRPMLVRLGLGGLCLHCDTCHFPNCSFGTGA